MMASLCVFKLTMDMFDIMRASRELDVAAIVGANSGSYYIWCVIILIYGVFVPNTWRRAAVILLPVACIPYAFTFAVSWSDPFVNYVLDEMSKCITIQKPSCLGS